MLKGNKFLPEKILNIVNAYDYKDLGDGRTFIKAGADKGEFWLLNDKLHREDGPAVIYRRHGLVQKEWYLNGKHHRVDGPAIEYAGRRREWYIKGKHLGTTTRGDSPPPDFIAATGGKSSLKEIFKKYLK